MKLFNLNFASLILRFYLLMAIVIGAFFIGYPILSLLSLPVFFSAMMGIKFTRAKNKVTSAAREKVGSRSAQHQAAH